MTRSDLQMIRRAVRNGWDVDESARRRTVQSVRETASNPLEKDYVRRAARETLRELEAAGWIQPEVASHAKK